ncbi:MAG TPA: 4-alpha-glucanotransferase [Bryobacteraceae bacterium]|nr:4-alpha-glucanotransferase [Bryobacteraceae bacterium]
MPVREPREDAIRALAEKCGVQQQFWDVFGKAHKTDTETNRSILASLGYDCSSEQSLEESSRPSELPPVIVVGHGETISLSGLEEAEVMLENGEVRRGLADLPLGYHEVRAGGSTMRLIVAPDRAYAPPARCAGLGVTLYGLRSQRNWGCGDFRDLRDLISWAVPNLHVDFIGLNPLHAIHNRTPYNASPYLPNSVFYRNFLYLDVEDVPGFGDVRDRFLDAETVKEIEALREPEIVQYEKVAALKRRALELVFANNPPDEDCRRWIWAEGELLRLFALYSALDEWLHVQNPKLWVWTDWPEEYQDPKSAAVAEFERTHAGRILFHGWLQWLVDRQIAEVQRFAIASGMKIGLYHDLALATDRYGSDLWARRDFFVKGARVGSPPDSFSPNGQDWSFPPPYRERHMEDGYRTHVEALRKTMRHGGALRMDHVMSLFRLYWIPEGHDPKHGAYVRDRATDLVRLLALESVRNKCCIVGEDLGTVEPEVRQTLADYAVMSYRLLIFEKDDHGFKLPEAYPEQALTSTTTHDLPTLAGFWTGQDIDDRHAAGAIDDRGAASQRKDRARVKQKLLEALDLKHLLPPRFERHASKIGELTPEIHNAVMGFLAMTPCALWLVNQEDITREMRQQNLPGTTAEYPNWSRKMRWTIEELSRNEEAMGSSSMIRHWIARSGRASE